MIPRVLKQFNLFINGEGFAGVIEEVELPEIALKMEEYRGGGMDAPFEIDMGTEVMGMKATFGQYLPAVMKAFGTGARIQLRGSLVSDHDGSREAVIVEVGARGKKFTPGTWKVGDLSKPEHEFAVDYYRWNQAGVDIHEIDVVNMIRKVNGVDQLAGIRTDIGL